MKVQVRQNVFETNSSSTHSFTLSENSETLTGKIYPNMGDDFKYTMYIDAVNEQYAPTSRSNDRKLFSELTLLEYFNKYRNV